MAGGTVDPDKIFDSGLVRTAMGYELKRTMLVKGITPSAANSSYLIDALASTGIPNFASGHPANSYYGINLIARYYDVKPTGGPDSAWVTVTYVGFAPSFLNGVLRQYHAGVAYETTDHAYDGSPIQVSYKVWDGAAGSDPGSAPAVTAGGTVSAPFPYLRISGTRFYPNSFDPDSLLAPFIGRKNTGTWTTENIPDGKGLIMNCDATTEDGLNYAVTWEIMVRTIGWDAYAAYTLPSGSRPYNAFNGYLASGTNNGFTKVVVAGTADFNTLW